MSDTKELEWTVHDPASEAPCASDHLGTDWSFKHSGWRGVMLDGKSVKARYYVFGQRCLRCNATRGWIFYDDPAT